MTVHETLFSTGLGQGLYYTYRKLEALNETWRRSAL